MVLAKKEFTQFFPHSGWVEHDPEEIWKTTQLVLSKLYNNDVSKEHNIRGVVITNKREIFDWSGFCTKECNDSNC